MGCCAALDDAHAMSRGCHRLGFGNQTDPNEYLIRKITLERIEGSIIGESVRPRNVDLTRVFAVGLDRQEGLPSQVRIALPNPRLHGLSRRRTASTPQA